MFLRWSEVNETWNMNTKQEESVYSILSTDSMIHMPCIIYQINNIFLWIPLNTINILFKSVV